MKKIVLIIIRWIIVAILMVGIYLETGPFTTVALGYCMLTLEIRLYFMKQCLEVIHKEFGEDENIKKASGG